MSILSWQQRATEKVTMTEIAADGGNSGGSGEAPDPDSLIIKNSAAWVLQSDFYSYSPCGFCFLLHLFLILNFQSSIY